MKRQIRKILLLGSFLIGSLLAIPAFAALDLPKPAGLPGQETDTFTNVVLYYIDVFLVVVGIITVGFLIYGGFRYITSAGNEEQAEAGKKAIQNAIIGLVVVILSYVIVAVISNALFGRA